MANANGNLEHPASLDTTATPACSSRKRRRTSSNLDDSVDDMTSAGRNSDAAHVEAVCRKLMGEMTAKWREDNDQLRNELQQMETRVKDWVDERLGKHVDDLRREMQQTSVEQRNHAEEVVHEARTETQEVYDRVEEVNDELQVVKDETSELVDSRLDERVDAVRGELEEFLTEKMHEAQDRIVDHIRSNVYIDFNIYE